MENTSMTTAAQGATDAAADMDADYVSELEIDASPEAVFDALTTLSGLAGWWTTVTGSGLAAGELRFVFDGDGDGNVPLIMQVTAAQRPATVRWTCVEYRHLPDWAGTTLSFDVQPRQAGGCAVKFRHTGLTPRLACYRDCSNGWDHFLPSLVEFVESGQGRPWGSHTDVERREDRKSRNAARQDSAQGVRS
jgi:uncharacterized protein YndB with AHSA1/START domain